MASSFDILENVGPGEVAGFSAGAVNVGLRKPGRPDFALLLCPKGASAAATFTQNVFRTSSIEDALPKLKKPVKAVAVFSGNANACTGPHGPKTNVVMAKTVAKGLGVKPAEVLLSYTGVVGREFPFEKVVDAVEARCRVAAGSAPLATGTEVLSFAKGILTTDTREKVRAVRVNLGKAGSFSIAGCAKGAGMIHPNMATMLAYVTTDVAMTSAQAKSFLKTSVDLSFQKITVDGDTSTNDSCFLLASGASGLALGKQVKADVFAKALAEVMTFLAKEIARDGEGATKLVTVNVKGAANRKMADLCARKVTESLLFKCAVFGGDPNYGRILVALGNTGLPLKAEKVRVALGSIDLFKANKVQTPNIPLAADYLKKETNIVVNIALGLGKFQATAWTCDISYEYVKINAEYTT